MKKIPMLLAMVFDDKGNRVINNEINPKVDFIRTATDVIATRKVDGTAAMFNGDTWFVRRQVKAGKNAPVGFILEQTDPNTGSAFGWEPADNTGFRKMLNAAVKDLNETPAAGTTFELVGPKIQNNPENVAAPTLWEHGVTPAEGFPTLDAILANEDDLIGFLFPFFTNYRENGIEGVVWWVEGAPAVKLRVKDFYPEDDPRFKK